MCFGERNGDRLATIELAFALHRMHGAFCAPCLPASDRAQYAWFYAIKKRESMLALVQSTVKSFGRYCAKMLAAS